MSVPSVPGGWLPNSVAVQNSAFASPDPSSGMHSYDPSAGVLSQSGLDPNHFQQQQQNQLQNGNSRNSSPGFQAPAYSVNPVVPLKRPRPREDSISISPRPTPQGLPTSRSQTPLSQHNLAYQIYQNNQPAQQRQYTPVGYNNSHLQHGSTNASPSPVMQDQAFNAQGNPANPPKRVATQSPSPFSPAPSQQGFMSQGSPPPQSHTPRIDTPQSNGISQQQQQAYSQAYTQGFQSPAPTALSVSPAPGPGQGMAQNQMHAQMHAAQQQHPQGIVGQPGQMNPMAQNPNAMGQMGRPQQPQGIPGGQLNNPNQFMKSLNDFMAKKGTPLAGTPYIGNKHVNLVNLYATVIKMGGSQRVTMEGKWPQVAMNLGFPPEQYSGSVEEMAQIYKQNLGAYEEAWMRSQRESIRQKQQMAMQQQARQQNQGPNQNQLQLQQQQQQLLQQQQHQRGPSNGPMPIQTQTPTRPQQGISRPSGQIQTPQQPRAAPPNGFTPQGARQPTPHQQPPTTPSRASIDQTTPDVLATPIGFPMPKPGVPTSESAFLNSQVPATPKEASTVFNAKQRVIDTHGGLDVNVMANFGNELSYLRPSAPSYSELGLIDIHAMTMMLKSGLSAEIRVALNMLASVSIEARQSIALENCEDLLDTLVDVAEAQVEILGEHASEGSESVSMLSYEDVLRACQTERDTLTEPSRFGTDEHDLERAADKLLCITTVLRNLSFYESNHNALAGSNVVRFLSSVIERIGTCHTFLRSYVNLLDFMKDMITYLSNLSHAIILPSEEEALILLHLILAFSPLPLPHDSGRETLMFTPYSPTVHRYLPHAVDTLAKLLARDEPNRAFFRTIYLSESATTPTYDLLTRSFALAISPVPDYNRQMQTQAIEARKPTLEQGLLAAEILSQIVPGSEAGVARAWLTSEDGFSSALLRLVCLLSPQANPMMARVPKMTHEEMHPYSRVTHRGMKVLRQLAAKSADPTDPSRELPQGLLPKKESLLGALLTIPIDPIIVRELCSYAGLDD
ncbi:hypothetical protein EDC01DRAFT_609381 [Geopyxis carbonaria]|nr:hypothetical protein EDC01DRAFT_609381 [Geopyxis carbonaria]